MKVTQNVLMRLEMLKYHLCLNSVNKGSEYFPKIQNDIYYVYGWEIKQIKPLFGPIYSKLIKILLKFPENENTNWHIVCSRNLDLLLDRMENDRINFTSVLSGLEKFGFKVNKIQNDTTSFKDVLVQ